MVLNGVVCKVAERGKEAYEKLWRGLMQCNSVAAVKSDEVCLMDSIEVAI